jgi:hypothetical protein
VNSPKVDTSPNSPAGDFSTSALIVWLLVVVLAVGYGLGGYGLIEPDEGRNAEVAREMAASNNYVLPHLTTSRCSSLPQSPPPSRSSGPTNSPPG